MSGSVDPRYCSELSDVCLFIYLSSSERQSTTFYSFFFLSLSLLLYPLVMSPLTKQKVTETESMISPDLSPYVPSEEKARRKSQRTLSEEAENECEEKTQKIDTIEGMKVCQPPSDFTNKGQGLGLSIDSKTD